MLLLRRSHYLVPAPPNGPVFHAATVLRRSSGWRAARTFSQFNRRVERQLTTTPGALAYSLQRRALGREFWTLSLWTDRARMLAFVRAGDHRVAADWLTGPGRPDGQFAQWEAPTASLRWDEVYTRLGSPTPKGRVLTAPNPVPLGWRTVPR
ncbi:MAG: hypothetical protein L3K16_09390 [Thermoplasmata archaeon]|nr:hypothetical protein [Thermoplasmata archaeon]